LLSPEFRFSRIFHHIIRFNKLFVSIIIKQKLKQILSLPSFTAEKKTGLGFFQSTHTVSTFAHQNKVRELMFDLCTFIEMLPDRCFDSKIAQNNKAEINPDKSFSQSFVYEFKIEWDTNP